MKRVNGILAFAAWMLVVPVCGATDALYWNSVNVSNPQIDATTVVNDQGALISVSTPLPFETASTLNVTNMGEMTGFVGFRFDYKPVGSPTRSPAANFVNLNRGVIRALDSPVALTLLDNGQDYVPYPSCVVAPVDPSYLLISATNIVDRAAGASLVVGPNGELQLDGQNIDLTRAGLLVEPVWTQVQDTFFQPYGNDDPRHQFLSDVAVYDVTAAETNYSEDYRLNTAALWDGYVATAPGIAGNPGSPGFQLSDPWAANSYVIADPDTITNVTITNIVGEATNVTDVVYGSVQVAGTLYKQAVFAGEYPVVATTMSINAGFLAGTDRFLRNAAVLIQVPMPNEVTGGSDTAYIYFEDDLAGETFRGMSGNLIGCPGGTERPQNYILSRVPYSYGSGNNGYPEPDFFTSAQSGASSYDIGFDSVTNAVVQAGEATGYQAFLDNIVSRPPAIPAGTVTNYPGRVRINASKSLDLSRTRIRAEGEIMINAANLISSTNAVIDCENLSFNLTSTNGNLNFDNLSKSSVSRLRGTITAYSALWSNSVTLIITNNYSISNLVTTNDAGEDITNMVANLDPITNTIGVTYHTLMLRPDLQTSVPVGVYGLQVHSTNLVISDSMNVVENMFVDAVSLTINSNAVVYFPGSYRADPLTGVVPPIPALHNWDRQIAPNLLYFTNHYSLQLPIPAFEGSSGMASFGWDGTPPVPYKTFVQTESSEVWAHGIYIRSEVVEDAGNLVSYGPIYVEADSIDFSGASVSTMADGNVAMRANNMKMNNSDIYGYGTVEFAVTNALEDAGPDSGNFILAQKGFRLPIKPATGDLLGTTLQSWADSFWENEHVWAGEDRGTNVNGYLNNMALGYLVLDVNNVYSGHYLRGAGTHNGLYVDVLDISAMGDNYQDMLRMDTNLVVYYAAVNAAVTLPPDTEAEEFLDGQFDGRLRWVSSYAGPNSSVPVVIDGQPAKANRALRNSKLIDSDGDGIPNYYDGTPFDTTVPLAISLVSAPEPAVSIQWTAAPETVYRVEHASNIESPDWLPLTYVTNSAPGSQSVVVYDTNAPVSSSQRFYRVRVWP